MVFNGVTLNERTEDYIRKRIEKIEKYLKNALEYESEVSQDKKGKFRVELMVKTPYNLFRAEETADTIEAAVDVAVDQLQIQIVRSKDKLKELRERGARSLKKKVVVDSSARFRK
jgi:ribosomal subunit interface protein